MAQLAIKGHPTRGKEVIQLLEMLGGKSNGNMNGYNDDLYYYIAEDGLIYGSGIEYEELACNYSLFTLEEFFGKFPYKVGDKVTNEYRLPMIIFDVYWDNDFNVIKYNVRFLDDDKIVRTGLIAEELQPYKEETMEEDKKVKGYCTEEPEDSGKTKKIAWFTFWDNDFADEVELYLKDRELVQKDGKCFVVKKNLSQLNLNELERKLDETLKEETMEEDRDEPKAPILSNRYDYAEGKCGYVIPDGYEFDYIKEGFQTEIILKPKKPQYPKDFDECCATLGYDIGREISFDTQTCKTDTLFENLYKLYICRNAYWEIAGAELGLDKPWKPDWESETEQKYTIVTDANEICSGLTIQCNAILAFPTAEMRDTFYENFKDLIEQCKELL